MTPNPSVLTSQKFGGTEIGSEVRASRRPEQRARALRASLRPQAQRNQAGGIVKTCGLACHDEVARSVAERGRSCRSDQEPSLTIRSVDGTQPVTNG
jgi:hypothetical protein